MSTTQAVGHVTCRTVAGYMALLVTPRGLAAVTWPQPTAAEAVASVGSTRLIPSKDEPPWVRELKTRLAAYWLGELVNFSAPLDPAGVSDFERSILLECAKVAYGQTVSYGDLARRAGHPGAARAVGQVMGRNPVGIVVP